MKRLVVERATNGDRLWRVGVADSWPARLRGLIGRPPPPEGEGLYFPGTNSIHMLFMGFAIDCVFLGAERGDGTRQVVAVRERLRPWTGVVWWVRHARGVIELPSGSVARSGVSVGDSLRFAPG